MARKPGTGSGPYRHKNLGKGPQHRRFEHVNEDSPGRQSFVSRLGLVSIMLRCLMPTTDDFLMHSVVHRVQCLVVRIVISHRIDERHQCILHSAELEPIQIYAHLRCIVKQINQTACRPSLRRRLDNVSIGFPIGHNLTYRIAAEGAVLVRQFCQTLPRAVLDRLLAAC